MSFERGVDGAPKGLPIVEPEEVGFSSKRLERIRPAMQRFIDSGYVPGVVTLIARHGRIAHFETQGYMDVENQIPVAKDTIFRIASMTKPVTSVALLMLYEEGRFLLDEPIHKFLPAFENPKVVVPPMQMVPAAREITFRDCLTHTAGFSVTAYWDILMGRPTAGYLDRFVPAGGGAGSNRPKSIAEAVEWLARRPLDFQPGTKWSYGPGHDVAGVLVEVISGQTLDDFMRERIFEPLGMPDTSFYLPEEKLPRFPVAYAVNPRNAGKIQLNERPEKSEKVRGPRVVFMGGGGLLSTPSDYARFAQMLLNGGCLDGVQILSRKTVELMTTNHTGDLHVYLAGAGYGFGLGVFVRTNLSGVPLVGSIGNYGWGGAYCTWYFADPKEDLFGLMFTQVLGYGMNPQLTIEPEMEVMTYQALAGS